MSILILGGTGMVGKNLQQSFYKNNINGIFIGRGKNNKYDLTDYSKIQKLFQETKPEIIVLLSANVGGIEYNKNNPAHLIRDNLLIGINTLDACVEFGIKQVYIISTCCAYPNYCNIPFKEDDLWLNYPQLTNAPYGIAKKTIIVMADTYRQQYGLKSTCFILANLYGQYDNFNDKSSHVIPALIKKFIYAKENNLSEVNCFGTGIATRDLLNAYDAANCITKAVINNFDYHLPINVGTSIETSIYSLTNIIKELVGYDGKIIFTGEVGDGQPRRCLDTTRAKNLLNWQATTPLIDGLKSTISWYLANRNA